jgi:hypothetical protein
MGHGCDAVLSIGFEVWRSAASFEACKAAVLTTRNEYHSRRERMDRKMARMGWMSAALVIATAACTCGLLPGMGKTPVAATSTKVPSLSGLETENAAGYETAMAMASEVGAYMTAPEDIPVYEPNESYSGSADLVSYNTSDSYEKVVSFYKKELPAQGWKKLDSADTLERAGSYAHLFYTKDDRTVDLTITATQDGKVIVLVSIKTDGS